MLKRNFLAALIAVPLLGACATAEDRASPIAEDKVVYHINNSDAQATGALRNIGNHLEVNPKAKIVLVAHARGVDFLMNGAKDKNGNPYQGNVERLKMAGVQFDICKITLRNRKLSPSKFLPEATYVPSGVAEITRLQQREGYAYLRP